VHPSPLYKRGSQEEEIHNTSHEPSSTASSYHLLVRQPSPGCIGDGNHHRDTPSCCGVFRSLSKAIYFRISAGNGVPRVIVVVVHVRVHGGAAHVVPESLLQDLHDLEVGYVVFIVNAFAGA
jgi:hypothetical protein